MASEQKSTAITPTGKPRRTRAEISAEAERKRVQKAAEREQKRAARAEKKHVEAEAKRLRAQARRKRDQAAEMKRIAAERKRRNRATRGRNVIALKPETPRHVFAERLQDDPEKRNWNHVVDESTLNGEDALIALLDAPREIVPMASEDNELSIADMIFLGVADTVDHIVYLTICLDMSIDEVIEMLVNIADETTLAASYDDELLPGPTVRVKSKNGGGYCKSDIPNEFHYSMEARRGNGWKVHRLVQYAT